MDVDKLAAEVRLATRRLRSRGPGRRYPASMREKAEDYLHMRRQAGAPVGLIARELGLGSGTLARWARRRRSAGIAFVPVRVEAAPAVGIVVHAPGGLRIEGLDVAALVDLVRRLT
jgi:transposase